MNFNIKKAHSALTFVLILLFAASVRSQLVPKTKVSQTGNIIFIEAGSNDSKKNC